tara:strand:- start:194 stop:766 length:573 start_codon:yes stop_codon:yes gene_type:complete
MKKIVYILVISFFSVNAQKGNTIFKGISEGMTKKVFKAEFKKNKSDYRGVELGNGITWVLAQSNAIYKPKDNLIGIKFIAKGALYPINDLGNDETQKYLRSTVDYLKNNGYTLFYEDPDEDWDWPRLFNYSNNYGAVLINYMDKKVAHLIPFEWEVQYERKFIPYFELFSLEPFLKKWESEGMGKKKSDL